MTKSNQDLAYEVAMTLGILLNEQGWTMFKPFDSGNVASGIIIEGRRLDKRTVNIEIVCGPWKEEDDA